MEGGRLLAPSACTCTSSALYSESWNPLLFLLDAGPLAAVLAEFYTKRSTPLLLTRPVPPMPFDPPVLVHKSSLMQKLADYVRFGYTAYVDGTVRAHRAAAFVRKMATYYRVDLGADRNYRARSKAAGHGCAILLLYAGAADALTWFLLVSPGPHPARSLERLKSALERDTRIVVHGDYELVRYTRAGARPSWTWRATEETCRGWRQRAIECVRKRDDRALRQMIFSLYGAPGFAGVRRQVGKTIALVRAEWKRAGRSSDRLIFPTKLPYIARLKSESLPLTSWLRRTMAANPRERELHAPITAAGAAGSSILDA